MMFVPRGADSNDGNIKLTFNDEPIIDQLNELHDWLNFFHGVLEIESETDWKILQRDKVLRVVW